MLLQSNRYLSLDLFLNVNLGKIFLAILFRVKIRIHLFVPILIIVTFVFLIFKHQHMHPNSMHLCVCVFSSPTSQPVTRSGIITFFVCFFLEENDSLNDADFKI